MEERELSEAELNKVCSKNHDLETQRKLSQGEARPVTYIIQTMEFRTPKSASRGSVDPHKGDRLQGFSVSFRAEMLPLMCVIH